MTIKFNHLIISALGTVLEWAEFSYYGYLAILFAQLFFPNLSNSLGVLAAFVAFAMSYVVRPIGSLLFGWIGDRYGRRHALIISLLLMGCSSLGMGLLPTYQSIGVLTVVLLSILRLLQGLAISGEFTGAAIYVIELSPQRPYFSASLISAFAALGMCIGVASAYLVTQPNMPIWAWRVPFLLASLCCLLGWYMRLRLLESLDMHLVEHSIIHLWRQLWQKYKFALIRAGAIAAFMGSYIYTCNVWWTSFAAQAGYFSQSQAKILALIGQGLVVVMTPILGWYIDKYHCVNSLRYGLIAALIVSPLLFWISSQQSIGLLLPIIVCYALINASISSTMFCYMANLFPVSVRYTGVAFAWNLAIALFASCAPVLAQLAYTALSYSIAPAYYVMFSAMIALILITIRRD